MLNINELKRYVEEEHSGNICKAAKSIGISHSGLYRIITGQRNPGIKTISAIIENCSEDKGYIFLNQALPNVNAELLDNGGVKRELTNNHDINK